MTSRNFAGQTRRARRHEDGRVLVRSAEIHEHQQRRWNAPRSTRPPAATRRYGSRQEHRPRQPSCGVTSICERATRSRNSTGSFVLAHAAPTWVNAATRASTFSPIPRATSSVSCTAPRHDSQTSQGDQRRRRLPPLPRRLQRRDSWFDSRSRPPDERRADCRTRQASPNADVEVEPARRGVTSATQGRPVRPAPRGQPEHVVPGIPRRPRGRSSPRAPRG